MISNLGSAGYDSTLYAIPLVLVFCPRFYYTVKVMDKEVAKIFSIYSVICPTRGLGAKWVRPQLVSN